MTFSAPAPWLGGRRRMAACLAWSIGAHLLAVVASAPTVSVLPRTILPAIDVRLVELSPAATAKPVPHSPAPAREQQAPTEKAAEPAADRTQEALPERAAEPAPERTPVAAPGAVDAAQTIPLATSSRESPRAIVETVEASKPPAESEQLVPEPALTEAEKANINARYLAESAVDRKATALDEVPVPEYPPAALKDGITGCVLVMVYIGANGAVEDIDVIRSDPPGIFDREAMRAFINKRYLPAIQGNTPVRSRVPGVASFELEGKPPLLCALRYYPLVAELNGQPAASAAPAAQR